MATYISKERSELLKSIYTGHTRKVIKEQTWRNVLCRIRKTTDADPYSEEFKQAVFMHGCMQVIKQQLHPSQFAKLSTVKDKVAVLVSKFQHIEEPLTFLKALEEELCMEIPYSTRYRYVAFARKFQFTEREQMIIAYKVMLRKIGCSPTTGYQREIKSADPDKCGSTHSQAS
jgi:hypothetical protein